MSWAFPIGRVRPHSNWRNSTLYSVWVVNRYNPTVWTLNSPILGNYKLELSVPPFPPLCLLYPTWTCTYFSPSPLLLPIFLPLVSQFTTLQFFPSTYQTPLTLTSIYLLPARLAQVLGWIWPFMLNNIAFWHCYKWQTGYEILRNCREWKSEI